MRLKDKVALVTGSGSGIGFAIARRFAEEGATVIVNDVVEEKAKQATQEIKKITSACDYLPADITDAEQVENMVNSIIEKYGRIDILINNAGVLRDNYLTKMPEQDWDFVLNVNLKGPYICSKAVVPHMMNQKYGRIVSISSRAYLGNVGQANYSASKGGLVSLTRTLAVELGKFGINVNAIAPGLIDTPLVRGLRPDVLERLIQSQPTKQMGKPEDIAAAAAFLVSEEGNFITGEVLHVDGGKSVGARVS